jgi:hypothetical protein
LGKTALLPGQTATFQDYTSYTKGLNGIIITFDNLPNPAALTAADFEFRVGNNNSPSGWVVAPAPSGFRVHQDVTLAPFAGVPDVVTITWADENPYTPGREPGAISNQWLQVVVLANARTGLAAHNVFYFGNQIAESGSSATETNVDPNDEIGARNHPHTAFNPALLSDPYDYNRDGRVDVADEILARNNPATAFTRIRLIGVPAGVQGLPGAAAEGEGEAGPADAVPWVSLPETESGEAGRKMDGGIMEEGKAEAPMLCAALPTPHPERPSGLHVSGDLRSAVAARPGDLRRTRLEAWPAAVPAVAAIEATVPRQAATDRVFAELSLDELLECGDLLPPLNGLLTD